MKILFRLTSLMIMLVVPLVIYTSCTKDETGEPVITYVRVTKPSAADSLLVGAGQGHLIAIMGQNLQGAQKIWFNDQQAILTSTYITSTTILVSVPSEIPLEITNKIKIIFAGGKELLYDFVVVINPPVATSMDFEYVADGAVATIHGNYFYEPVTVTFAGGIEGEVLTVEDKVITVKVPIGAQAGPLTVTTNFGSTPSTFWFRDNRNIFLNYDNLNASGSWRPGTLGATNALDANYVLLKGVLDKNQRTEDYPNGGYVSEFWAGANGRPEGNLLPGNPEDYTMKFEANIPGWYGSYLNICFAPWNQNGDNQEYWSNSKNARAVWGPWETADKNFETDGWITVSIPMTEFRYAIGNDSNGNVVYTDMKFDKNVTGSLTFWVVGSPKANASPVEIHIDNVRIVPNK